MLFPTEYFTEQHIIDNCTIEITNQCHSRCIHCDYPKKYNGEFLPLDTIIRIAKELKDLGTFRITLSGGEPFEHPQITEITKSLIQSSFAVKIITNGQHLSEDFISSVQGYSRLHIAFSALGTYETHDALTGVQGSFDAMESAIDRLKNTKCHVSIQTSVMRNNVNRLAELVDFCKDKKIDWCFDPVITNTMSAETIQALRLTDDELLSYYKKFTPMVEVAKKVIEDNAEVRIFSCDCGVAKRTLTITANGDVFPCGNLRIKVGNITEDSIAHIWKYSSLLNYIRNDLKKREECLACNLSTLCNGCLAMAFTEHHDWNHVPKEWCRHIACLRNAVYDQPKK